MATATVTEYAVTITCKSTRHRFLMELGRRFPHEKFTSLMAVETMNRILESI